MAQEGDKEDSGGVALQGIRIFYQKQIQRTKLAKNTVCSPAPLYRYIMLEMAVHRKTALWLHNCFKKWQKVF